MLKTSFNYYKLQILNQHFSQQPHFIWLQSKVHIQFIFYFIILLSKLSYSIHPFHASFHIHQFHASLNVADIPDEVLDEFTELRNDSTAHDLLKEKTSMEFWCAIDHSYPNVALLLLRVPVPFALPIFVKVFFKLFCKLKPRQEIDWMFKITGDWL